jgi:hypothetical protein
MSITATCEHPELGEIAQPSLACLCDPVSKPAERPTRGIVEHGKQPIQRIAAAYGSK